jgi:hypothetical protein
MLYNSDMKGFLLSLLFISVSCTKWSEVEETNGIHVVKNISSAMHTEKMIEWEVGKQRGATISKGFSFKVDIPKIDSDGREELLEKYGIDAWIYDISKVDRGRKQHLGYVIFDLKNMSRITTDVTIHLFYHAASVSQDFRKFHCPAFDHRLLISDFDLVTKKEDEYNAYTKKGTLIRGRVTRPSFAPVIFSAGTSLVGKYIVELALFNTQDKKIYSPFKKVSNYIEVKSEERVSVPSCIGIKEENNPLPSSQVPNIRDLEIK